MGRARRGEKDQGPKAGSRPEARRSPSQAGAEPKGRAPGAERRRHPRVRAAIPFKIVNEAGQEESFDLVDLSESGARIRCGHSVPAMTRIQVALLLPGQKVGLVKDVRVDTTGVVVWCHRADDAKYDTGVFFSDLEDEQRSLLRTLVNAAL